MAMSGFVTFGILLKSTTPDMFGTSKTFEFHEAFTWKMYISRPTPIMDIDF